MLGEVEPKGRMFRLQRQPMMKVKQVGPTRLCPGPSRIIARDLATAYVITLDVSAVDVRLETPIDEAEARLGSVSQIVGHRPLSRPVPFQVPSWSFLESQVKLHSLAVLGSTYLEGPRTMCRPLWTVACCPELQ